MKVCDILEEKRMRGVKTWVPGRPHNEGPYVSSMLCDKLETWLCHLLTVWWLTTSNIISEPQCVVTPWREGASLVRLNMLTWRNPQDIWMERHTKWEETGSGKLRQPEVVTTCKSLIVRLKWRPLVVRDYEDRSWFGTVRGRDPESRMEWPQST